MFYVINSLDLTTLPIDQVDILQHFIPTEQELKAFSTYLDQGKNIRSLSEEDQFLFAVILIIYFINIITFLI